MRPPHPPAWPVQLKPFSTEGITRWSRRFVCGTCCAALEKSRSNSNFANQRQPAEILSIIWAIFSPSLQTAELLSAMNQLTIHFLKPRHHSPCHKVHSSNGHVLIHILQNEIQAMLGLQCPYSPVLIPEVDCHLKQITWISTEHGESKKVLPSQQSMAIQ